jgi:uncharacterized caspase-like protein/WD40 repeat protein
MRAGLRKALGLLLVVLGVAAGRTAAAETPDFFLDLDTGGHRAFIKDIAFTSDGRTLVSASDDKTIRIWDWESGVTLRTLRGFVGPGNDGKTFAVAVSPDGKTIATGGYFGAGLGDKPPYGDVRLFDLATGKVKAALKAPEYPIYDVAFSPDGDFLAAGGEDGFVFVWQRDDADASGWKPFAKLDADSWHVQQVAFAEGGKKLAATTTDNGIRLWDMPSGSEIAIADAEPLRDSPVMALAVSADGALFATGSSDGVVQVWRAADGALVRTMPKQDFLIGSLTFAAGGERLIASCGYRCADQHRTIVWTVADGTEALQQRSHDGTVYASATSPDGTLVATAGGTRLVIRLWDPLTGEEKHVLHGIGEPVTAVGIDPDGASIAWGVANPCPDRVSCPEVMGELAMKLDLPTAERFFENPAPLDGGAAGYRRAVLSGNGWTLQAAAGGKDNLENAVLDIRRDGKPAARIENDTTNGYLHAAFSLIGDGAHLVTGGNDGTLIEYDSATASIEGEFSGGHTGEINSIAIAENAGLMVTGSADQTIRLWNLKTRELIVSLFFAGKEFVIWMPQGYYYSSDEGDKLIGWHVNQGRGAEGRFIRAGQLKKYLWSPEMVRRAIILRSTTQAVLEMRPGVDNELQRLLERRPPEFDVKLADDQQGVPDGFVAVEITAAQEAGTDVSDFSILSNSRNVGGFASRSISGDGKKAVIQVPVEDGENQITVTGVNEYGYLTERSVVALARKAEESKPKGKLYVVAIGADKYPFLAADCSGQPCDLRYPVADASQFLKVLVEESGALYSGVEALVLVNRESLDENAELAAELEKIVGVAAILEPESDNIGDQIADFLDRPGADDTTMVFVAGHGINIDEDYYFIPSDGRKSDPEKWKRSSLVDWADIQKAVERAEGVRFMLLDTCHAANAFNPRLEKDAADARIVVFSATAANSTAAELPELGHGVFTYSVLEGLRGKADTGGDGVRLLGLADFIYREVTKITNARQKPFYYISSMENILLAGP